MGNDELGPRNAETPLSWTVSVSDRRDGSVLWQAEAKREDWHGCLQAAAPDETQARADAQRAVDRFTNVFCEWTAARTMPPGWVIAQSDASAGNNVPSLERLSSPRRAASRSRWDRLTAASADWQTRGGRQQFVVVDGSGTDTAYRLRELFGCMGALGEQAMLACAAARDLDQAIALSDSADAELRRRAWAEHVMHWAMAAGHMLLNVAGRAMALDQAARASLVGERGWTGTDFTPEADAHDDWPTLNKQHANAVRRSAATSACTSVRDVGELPHGLVVDARWQAMARYRGEAFHRWRAQTLGTSTATRRMAKIVGNDGLLPDGTRHDVRGPESSAGSAGRAQDALEALQEALSEFDTLLPKVLDDLTSTTLHEDGLLTVRGDLSWVELARGTAATLLPADEHGRIVGTRP